MFAVYSRNINVQELKLVIRICIYSTRLSSKKFLLNSKTTQTQYGDHLHFSPCFRFQTITINRFLKRLEIWYTSVDITHIKVEFEDEADPLNLLKMAVVVNNSRS